MKPTLPPYLSNFPKCEDTLKNKHILFDANVLISACDDYNAENFFDHLQSFNVVFTTIHPVLVEVQATNDNTKRALRQRILNKYNFNVLPLTKPEFDKAREIQIWLSTVQCFPEPTDLYLGGVLSKYDSNLLLATSNLKDFPFPLFYRECYAILQNKKQANLISFLKIDESQLLSVQLETSPQK